MRVEALMLKLVMGRSASSSSLDCGDGGSSLCTEPSVMKDSWDTCERLVVVDWKRACLVCLIGEDSGSPSRFFHVSCRAAAPLVRRPVAAPDSACCCMLADLILLNLEPPPDLGRSSEKSGSVIGDEARPLLECSRLEVVEAVSEMVSLLDAGRFLLIRSSTRGSMASRLKFCHPFWILTLANARRSCSVRVICLATTG